MEKSIRSRWARYLTFFVVCLWTSTVQAAPPAADVDGNGKVNALDVQVVINGVLGIGTHLSQDINFDSRVNALDIQLVVNAVLGIDIDADGEGLADVAEGAVGTDPSKPDTDSDGLSDLQEVVSGSDPLVAENGAEIPVDIFHIGASTPTDGIVFEAVEHFRKRVMALGGPDISQQSGSRRDRTFFAGVIPQESNLSQYFSEPVVQNATIGWQPFQKDEGYFLGLDGSGAATRLYAGGLSPLGAVYAVSELELRLRVRDGRVVLVFPEWQDQLSPTPIASKPAIEKRGEYINVGYDIPEITPHQWTAERCEAYVDKLVLAKLNRFYFYIWTNVYSIYPDSENAQNPVSISVHQNIKRMIEHAHKRGLEVVYMYCPTFFPQDVWNAHPEFHAVIEYVDWGFPAACPSAPRSWALMDDLAKVEFEWFKAADAIQVWFYDPGGCWCDRYGATGCYQNQAGILAEQVRYFGELFQGFNPNARIEYNLWPIWLWEQLKGFPYRQSMDEKIKTAFGSLYSDVTAVGAIDNDTTRPLVERDLGFRTSVFVFGTNPETGYVFPTPHLRWLGDSLASVPSRGLNGAFTHRLEAWTRYLGTYISSRLMWDPSADSAAVLREFAEWQTADPTKGGLLAQVFAMLDHFTDKGATAGEAAQMRALGELALAGLPAACAADLEYWPATLHALDAIARSIGVTDPATLDSLAAEFQQALGESPTYSALVPGARVYFDRYRGFLAKGYQTEIF